MLLYRYRVYSADQGSIWASLVAQTVKNLPEKKKRICLQCGTPKFGPWVTKIPTKILWRRRREWQPTPIFLPGKFHEQRSQAGCSPWGCKESDMTVYLHTPYTCPSPSPSLSLPLSPTDNHKFVFYICDFSSTL